MGAISQNALSNARIRIPKTSTSISDPDTILKAVNFSMATTKLFAARPRVARLAFLSVGSATIIDDAKRRTLLVKAIPYLVATYWEAGARVSPTTILTRIMQEYEDLREQIERERGGLQSILNDVDSLNITFEDGKLSFDLDRTTMLGLVATYLKKSFAKEGGTVAIFSILAAQLVAERHYDAELKLGDRSVYARLVFREPSEDETSSYLEEAQRVAPSEFWVFSLKEGNVDIRLQTGFCGRE